jgi:hypothetical protein
VDLFGVVWVDIMAMKHVAPVGSRQMFQERIYQDQHFSDTLWLFNIAMENHNF